jgi:hypothetical protein
LAPFERYMVADDRPGYPMTFFIRVALEGTPDRQAMDAAFADTLKRHPLLTSRLQRRGTRLCWVAAPGPRPELHWDFSDTEPPLPVGAPIDLRRGVGLRGYVHSHGGKAVVVVSFHHAACDGIGGFRFVGDLLAHYGRRTASGGKMPKLLPIETANLAYRGMFDIRLPIPITHWVALKATVREIWKVVSRPPQVLCNQDRPSAAARKARPTMPVEYLSPETYGDLCVRAGEQGATVNDVLMRDMFLAIREWNETRGGRRRGGWLRITMPTSLRGKRDSRMPAANTLGYALVTRHTDACDDPARLLAGVAADTEFIRTWSLGAMFVDMLRVAGRVPGLMWLGTRLGRRYSTLVLSNLGDPSRRFRARFPRVDGEIVAGDVTVKDMYGAPPIRPGTRAALALFSYADKLAIALHPDPRWFSPEDARQFLSMYRRRLERSAATTG